MAVERRFESTSEEATCALAAEIGRRVPPRTLIALSGDLGAGKTTFVRGLAAGLGLENGVASPTYTLMQAHEGGRLPLYHFDAWMEGREKAWLRDGGDAWLHGDGVAVVEWAGRVSEWLPEPRLEVDLFHLGIEERGLRISSGGTGGDSTDLEALIASLDPQEGLSEREGAFPGESDFRGED